MAYKRPVVNEATGRIEMVEGLPPNAMPSCPGPCLAAAWPVGAIFISTVSTNPATQLGFGTWEVFGAGRMMVGLDAGDPSYDTVEETGGTKTVVLTTNELPAHSHGLNRFPTATGASSGFTGDTSMSGSPTPVALTTQLAGGGAPFSVMNPYVVVRLWRRTD